MGLFKNKYESDLIKKSESGDISAMITLSECYGGKHTEFGVKKNDELCDKWILKAADKGDGHAKEICGNGLCGLGLDCRDKEMVKKGIKYLEDAFYCGIAEAGDDLGYLYGDEDNGQWSDPNKAFHWYSLAAEAGFPRSQWKMAKYYFNGEFVQTDLQQAKYWIECAINNKNIDKTKLSRYYLTYGMILDSLNDRENSIKYLKISVDLGDSGYEVSAYFLGSIYEEINNIPEAIKYYKIGSSQNHTGCKERLAVLKMSHSI